MGPRIGYLLPTRERIMQGAHEAGPILNLAERAEGMGFDSVWIGDSLLARPRHDPMTMLAAVAARTSRVEVGTAVLLPALRNPVLLAHMAATVDQISEGRLILGVGIAADVKSVRAEFEAAGVPFEKRVGRMMEGIRLCRALWQGEDTDWQGRWTVEGGHLAPHPVQTGGPRIWAAASVDAGLRRIARELNGWFPIGPNAAALAPKWQLVQEMARGFGRNPDEISFSVYLTIMLDNDADKADQQMDAYMQNYYSVPPHLMRSIQANYAGPEAGLGEWLQGFADAGASHLVLRFAGDQESHLDAVTRVRQTLGW